MKELRLGIIGAGLNGETHAVMLHQIATAWPDRVHLTAVADIDPARTQRMREQYGFRNVFASADELLRSGEANAVFICTPTKFHHDSVILAAQQGLHIFCEKPLAMSYSEGRAMVEAVEAAGVRAQIGLVLRFSPVYTVMRDLLAQPDAADPMAIVFRDDQCFPTRGLHHTSWRNDRDLTAGGTLIEHGVHDLDLLVWMFGPMRRLRAWEQNRFGHPGVEDFVSIEIELESGLRAQLVNVWHDMLQRPSNRRLEIFCRRGFVASEHDMFGEIEVQWADAAKTTISGSEVFERFKATLRSKPSEFGDWFAMPYFTQDLAFVEALLADRAPEPDLGLGLEAQRLAEAVYAAARTNQEIDLRTFQTDSPGR